jgi:hypothetical protein
MNSYRLAPLATVALLLGTTAAFAAKPLPSDVPANHWAGAAVSSVLSRSVMTAPGGKFAGSTKVSRTELANVMVAFAKVLEQGAWPKTTAKALPRQAMPGGWASQPVTRYELAALLDRMGSIAAQGLPRAGAKRYGPSKSFPPAADISNVAKSDPAYPALSYLVKNRMLWKGSVLVKPGSQPVTGGQVADEVSAVISSVNDRLTDDPQNQPEIPERPKRP